MVWENYFGYILFENPDKSCRIENKYANNKEFVVLYQEFLPRLLT